MFKDFEIFFFSFYCSLFCITFINMFSFAVRHSKSPIRFNQFSSKPTPPVHSNLATCAHKPSFKSTRVHRVVKVCLLRCGFKIYPFGLRRRITIDLSSLPSLVCAFLCFWTVWLQTIATNARSATALCPPFGALDA